MLGGQRLTVEFVVDTGFAGYLTLPREVVEAMQLPYDQDVKAQLADGADALLPVHIGTIAWEASTFEVPVISVGNRPLLGTALIAGYEITAQLIEGGDVTIRTI